MITPEFQFCLSLADLGEKAAMAVTIGGRPIVICQFEGELFAIENKCSHADEPLACGRIRNGWIACPAHGARFDLATGEVLGPPATEPIKTYPVRLVGASIEVAI
jgi:nitrite reductase/ring-hydroxylating ferredoxin subunit